MSANQAMFPVAVMARALGVSRAGFHAWSHRSPSARTMADAVLLKRIRTIHATSRETYGAPRCARPAQGDREEARMQTDRTADAQGRAGWRQPTSR